MNKILVLAPYHQDLLMALGDVRFKSLAKFILVGNKNRILEQCFKLGIAYQNFIIIGTNHEIDILMMAEEIKKKEKIDFLILGDILEQHKIKILNCKSMEDLATFSVLDINLLKHFVYISNLKMGMIQDFDDKKKSILQAKYWMNYFDIKKINCCLIGNNHSRMEILECNIIKMNLMDQTNINIMGVCTIRELFDREGKYNIYNMPINLLQFRDYESSFIFLDTLSEFGTAKVAHFITYQNQIAVDFQSVKHYSNMLFTLFTYLKLCKKKAYIAKAEQVMV